MAFSFERKAEGKLKTEEAKLSRKTKKRKSKKRKSHALHNVAYAQCVRLAGSGMCVWGCMRVCVSVRSCCVSVCVCEWRLEAVTFNHNI